ncbi:MAG: hypothetical protein ACK5S3_01675, partial [Pirellulaceae bacterium]
STYDRLTHPTVPAHEWNVWFWCVRGRVDWAIYLNGARHSNTVSKSFGLSTGSHTLRWIASSATIAQQVARSATGSHTLRSSDRES